MAPETIGIELTRKDWFQFAIAICVVCYSVWVSQPLDDIETKLAAIQKTQTTEQGRLSNVKGSVATLDLLTEARFDAIEREQDQWLEVLNQVQADIKILLRNHNQTSQMSEL
jgi:hypothetical protein